MNRTDPHSPTNLVTEDYEFAYAYDAHPEDGDRGACMVILNRLIEDGWHFGQVHGGDTCDHCGARLRYVAVLKHLPTHTLIKVGETCLDNRFALATPEFHRLRTAAKLNRERRVMREVREAFAADHRDVIDWLVAKSVEADARFGYVPDHYDLRQQDYGWLSFPLSLYATLMRKGTLSDAQVNAARSSATREHIREVKRAEALKDASPVPSGRERVTGVITKLDISSYGPHAREVMTVCDDRGFKVWGTQPRALYDAKVGDRVTFEAALEPSDRDQYFGFFKRPTRPAIID
jgi:hypothetical protein